MSNEITLTIGDRHITMNIVPQVPGLVPPPQMSSVHDAMVSCGVDDTAGNTHEGRTQATRVASDIFFDSYDTVAKKSMTHLENEFKTYANLTVANGKIPLNPGIKNRIKAFVQWTRDEIRLGRNPARLAYVTGDEARLLERMREHDRYVSESSTLASDAKPATFTNDDNWEEFDRKFQGYLRLIPGSNGVPLLYVIRTNVTPNPMPQPDYLDEYINAAPLVGTSYIADNQKAFVLFQALIAHEQALSVIMTQNTTTDGRSTYFAVKRLFEGSGIMQTKVTNAEKTIRFIKYKGEIPPYMWWTKFEQELLRAYAVIDTDAGQGVYNDAQKLRQLQEKIQCDWLANHKATVDAEIAKIPMTMTFATALSIYRNAVNRKHPPGAPIQRRGGGRRGISEVTRGRGQEGQNRHGGHGGRGRGHAGRGRRGGNRNHPDQETIVLKNRQHIQYHPSYLFTREELQQMTQGQRDRLKRERAEYRERQGISSRQQRTTQRQQIQALMSEVATLRSVQEQMSIPGDINVNRRTDVSQVTTGSSGGGIIGGRNQQARQCQQRQQGEEGH